MWVFTQDGFVSAVDNNEVAGKLTVRARDRHSLQNIADLFETEIVPSPFNDYQYRTHVTKDQFGEWMMLNAQTLDYDNFKNRVYRTRGGDFAHALADVWSAMCAVADDESIERYQDIRARRTAVRG